MKDTLTVWVATDAGMKTAFYRSECSSRFSVQTFINACRTQSIDKRYQATPIPAGLDEIQGLRLFHCRLNAYLQPERTLVEQGVEERDVLVFTGGESDDIGEKISALCSAGAFPDVMPRNASRAKPKVMLSDIPITPRKPESGNISKPKLTAALPKFGLNWTKPVSRTARPFSDTADGPSLFNRRHSLVTAIIVAVIIYGSLYPFVFQQPVHHEVGTVMALINTWNETPGRGDFISNIMLYLPLGFFGVLSMTRRMATWKRLLFASVLGALLSISIELTQYYDAGRDEEATDVYSNTLGTVLGALARLASAGFARLPLPRDIVIARIPSLLLVVWLGYRLYPYVPVIDLHKYWDALKPVVLYPSMTAYDLFRHSAIWLTLAALIAASAGYRRSRSLFPAFAGAVLFAKILIIGKSLSLDEVAGAVVAYGLWLILGANAHRRHLVAALLLGIYVVASRLEPFQFQATAGHFNWIPFLGFMQGSINVDVMSFLEKFFLYGGLIWLLAEVGLRFRVATVCVAAGLFITSYIEIYLPARSAEITDALMAFIIAGAMSLTDTEKNAGLLPGTAVRQA